MKVLRSLTPAAVIALGILADQASKVWILQASKDGLLPFPVTSYFNVTFALNRGVSFSFLASNNQTMPFVLAGFSVLVSLGLMIWLLREDNLWTKVGISFIVSGALGNALDRVRIGAVVDFLDFHALGWHFPAFNIADMAINLGVALIVIQMIFFPPNESK